LLFGVGSVLALIHSCPAEEDESCFHNWFANQSGFSAFANAWSGEFFAQC
jgi:hypothetical protein